MTLATGSGIAASIVAFNLINGVATVASVVVALIVVAMVALAAAPLVSSDWADQQTTTASGAEPSDD